MRESEGLQEDLLLSGVLSGELDGGRGGGGEEARGRGRGREMNDICICIFRCWSLKRMKWGMERGMDRFIGTVI